MAGTTSNGSRDSGKVALKEPEFRDGIPFVGGRLWLDLLNTTPIDANGHPVDLIATETGLAAWLAAARLAPGAASAPRLLQSRIVALRTDLRTAFETMRSGGSVPETAVAAINQLLDTVAVRARLERDGDGLRLATRIEPGNSGPAGMIAEDFARFSCEFEPERLKHCANPGCSMVFYDIGKNNVRRWCTMSICGNRDKVARFRARKAGSAGA